MPHNIDAILLLAAKERRKIVHKLLESLPENKIKLTEEETNLLNERWQKHLTGKSKTYTSKEMWKNVFNVSI